MTKKKERIWGYVESCAGGAAVALHLHGAKRALMPYQGSKWTYRKAIAALYEEMGFPGRPEQTFLNDPGPWHIAHQGLLEKRESVLGALGVYANGDPRGIYTSLLGDSLCASPALNAADFLFLQRLAYNCKAVTVREGRWVSPGFNPTSAYGTPATERFGAVRPMVPSLIKTIEALPPAWNSSNVHVSSDSAEDFLVSADVPVLYYIDPPYEGTTGYGHSFERHKVLDHAERLAFQGHAVVISEAERLDRVLGHGWEARQIAGPSDSGSPFKSKKPEWLTYTTHHEVP